MKLYTSQEYEINRKRYGILASLPIIAAILHLLAMVWMMSTINYHAETQDYSIIYTLGEMFSSASFASILAAPLNDAKTVSTIAAIVSISIALFLIFLSTSAVKGNKKAFAIAGGVYLLDTVMMIPTILVSFLSGSTIQLAVYDIILMILLHGVILAFFAWGIIISKNLLAYEMKQDQLENEIHISE